MKSFNRNSFFLFKKKISIDNLKSILKDNLIKNKLKDNFIIKEISSFNVFHDKSIIFIDGEKNIYNLDKMDICVITNNENNLKFDYPNIFLIKDLNECYNLTINSLFIHDDSPSYFDDFKLINGSHISKYSFIDSSSNIGRNCVIGRGVKIGKNCIIKDNVTIKNSIICSNVVICDNTTIGSTGFGFDFRKRGSLNLNPQIGIVFIDDNCHIGSSCTIDRGKIDCTYIGKNCMIDNLVHIAHNVILNDNACIAAQTGISGSVKIGSNVTIGGQSGLAGHINIGNNVIIAAKSGVTKNIKDNSTVAGFPAIDIKLWKKNIIRNKKNGY